MKFLVWLRCLFIRKPKKPDDVITGRKARKIIKNMDSEYWLSVHGVLHNSLCKWFRMCDGELWDGVKEFEDCGLCGSKDPIVHRWNLKK